jgi:catechol 2,3-dioxygenase-like lactoylglutathione lyase family enzyme
MRFGGRGRPPTMDPLHVTQVATVFVPVSDQERALAFYVGTLGFDLRSDGPYGDGHRWVEVAPPGSTYALALVPPTEGLSPGGDVTRCALLSTDVEADHAALVAAGVDVDPVVGGPGTSRPGLVDPAVLVLDPSSPQVVFRDPDGNRLLLIGGA